jgi:hypothetical protein
MFQQPIHAESDNPQKPETQICEIPRGLIHRSCFSIVIRSSRRRYVASSARGLVSSDRPRWLNGRQDILKSEVCLLIYELLIRSHHMLNHRRLLSAVTCVVLSLAAVGVTLDSSSEPSSDTIIAARYHLRQHSSTASGRFGFRSNRMSPANQSYRQHIDRPSPVGPHYLRPQEKVATRPANGVQS